MLPLVPLAISLVPELVRLIAGDKAGSVATSVADVVSQVTGTTDPSEAQARIAQDPAIAANLRVRLAEIALQAQVAKEEADEKKRQAELEEIRLSMQNTVNARDTLRDLAQEHSWIAAAPVVVSVVVTVGFFAFLIVLLFNGLKGVDNIGAQIINIAVGALTAGFATVINFWLGSSQGSRSKDTAARELQVEQGNRNRETIQTLKEVTQTVVASASSASRPAPPPPAEVSPVQTQVTTAEPAAAGGTRPVNPAPPGLLLEVLPGLVTAHQFFKDGVPWQLSAEGISVEGAPPRGTAGEPTTVGNIWKRYGDLCCASASGSAYLSSSSSLRSRQRVAGIQMRGVRSRASATRAWDSCRCSSRRPATRWVGVTSGVTISSIPLWRLRPEQRT